MLKETEAGSVLELLGKNLSAREAPKVLGVSRNTVAGVQALFLQPGRPWDGISGWGDDRPYGLFCPDRFKYRPGYAPVGYPYVHKELKRIGATEKLLWEEYCARCGKGGADACSYITSAKNHKKFTADKNYTSRMGHKPGLEAEVRLARSCSELYRAWDSLRTGVAPHPKRGGVALNEAHPSPGGYYSVAVMPTGDKRPKQKAGAGGSAGKIAAAAMAEPRNGASASLDA